MSVAAGTRFGPYEIVAALGAGGMGEVYRARDSRLGREVAIKVLPSSLARDPERLRRFGAATTIYAGIRALNGLAITPDGKTIVISREVRDDTLYVASGLR